MVFPMVMKCSRSDWSITLFLIYKGLTSMMIMTLVQTVLIKTERTLLIYLLEKEGQYK